LIIRFAGKSRNPMTPKKVRFMFRKKLNPESIQKIALVTHFWHMQRSERNFTQAEFTVIPAPVGQTSNN